MRKTAGVNPKGRQMVATKFDQLEIGRHFAFHESGQLMYRKNGPGTADRGITTIRISPEQRVHALTDLRQETSSADHAFGLGLVALELARRMQ